MIGTWRITSIQNKIGFDNEKYLREQTAEILERVERFDNKLYLEFGGKLLFDYHAARVLPGFDPNVKMRLLQQLKDKADVILCIYAGDIERKKMRADFGITYDADALQADRRSPDWGVDVAGVVITRYERSARRAAVQEQAGAARHPGVHPPLHQGISHRRGSDRERRGLRRQRLHRDRQAAGGGHRPRPRQRQAGHLPVASFTTSTAGASKPATPSSKPFRSGTCPSSTR